jgi:hypothetical protein
VESGRDGEGTGEVLVGSKIKGHCASVVLKRGDVGCKILKGNVCSSKMT